MRVIIKTISIPVDGKPLDFRLTKPDAFSGVSLLRQLFGELSDSAREALRGDALSGLPDLLSSAPAAAAPVIHRSLSSSVQAPVSIQVTAAGTDPEAVGKSIYDVAERYLLRTIRGGQCKTGNRAVPGAVVSDIPADSISIFG